jgi:hypothetical protein
MGPCRIMEAMESQIIRPGHLTAHQVARQLGVTLGGVRLLLHRGQLTRSGGTAGQPWYSVEDVAALVAKRRTRKAA